MLFTYLTMADGIFHMNYNLEDIFSRFDTGSEFKSAVDFGSGNINDTYAVEAICNDQLRIFLLQRINHFVFPVPASVMDNIIYITDHLTAKYQLSGVEDTSRHVLNFYPEIETGNYYYLDPLGNHWRLCDEIIDAVAHDEYTEPAQVRHAASAFGRFQVLLDDFPIEKLTETISGFMDGHQYYKQFCQQLKNAPADLVSSLSGEIAMIRDNASVFDIMPELIASGKIPMRVIHNDCKINNVMLDKATGHGVCVIDLDTVMPGIVLYDFGDLVRSVLSTSSDIDPKLNDGKIDLDMFAAAAQGYLSETYNFLTRAEVQYLAFAPQLMSLMLATRFLTDYLSGNKYFKIDSPDHNLRRCRSQLGLFSSLQDSYEDMVCIVDNLIEQYQI